MQTIALQENFWEHSFASDIYSFFSSVKHTLDVSQPPSSVAFEVEARLGLDSKKFTPGISHKDFQNFLDFYKRKNQISSFEETYDFTFPSSKTRVTILVAENEGKLCTPIVKECIRKDKLVRFPPVDAFLKGVGNKKQSVEKAVRVALNVEYTLPNTDSKEVEESLARCRALMQSDELRNKLEKIAGGGVLEITNQTIVPVEGLTWTILRKCEVPQEDMTEQTLIWVGNLPTDSVSAFEYTLCLPISDVRVVQVRDLKKIEFETSNVFGRHKKRWKVTLMGTDVVLDFTITGPENDLVYEVEMERSFTIDTKWSSVQREVRGFIHVLCSVLLSVSQNENKFSKSEEELLHLLGPRSRTELIPLSLNVEKPSETEKFYTGLNRSIKEERNQSMIFHMRNFNNFVKSMLIQRYFPHDTKMCRVLELACGKGADLFKLLKSVRHDQTLEYVGTDISKKSLEDAVKRLDKANNNTRQLHSYRFIAADLSLCDVSQSTWVKDKPLDVWTSSNASWKSLVECMPVSGEHYNFVSMQFAFHYMCKNREGLDSFLRGVSNAMVPGGHFVITTVDADALVNELLLSPFENKIEIRDGRERLVCQIEFENPSAILSPRSNEEEYKYQFRLFDGESDSDLAVNAPEYLVIMPILTELARKHNLEIVTRQRLGNFAYECLDQDRSDAKALWSKMNVPNWQGTMSAVEWRLVNLYQVIVFQKPDKVKQALEKCEKMPGWSLLSIAEKNMRLHQELEKEQSGVYI